MKTKLLILIIMIGIGAGVSIGYAVSHVSGTHANKQGASQMEMKKQIVLANVTPTVTPGIPETISIPKINVQTTVQQVGMDSEGRMGVPTNDVDTAWYDLGFRPGMNGSSVIDGHLDRVTGAPAVFWNLRELSVGDTITVTEDNGKKYTFAIDKVASYSDFTFPLKEVFAASNVPMLNLITCNGIWDKDTKNYSQRLVVFSKLVSVD